MSVTYDIHYLTALPLLCLPHFPFMFESEFEWSEILRFVVFDRVEEFFRLLDIQLATTCSTVEQLLFLIQ